MQYLSERFARYAMIKKSYQLFFLLWILTTTNGFSQAVFTWDTIFLKNTYVRRVSLSPANHCWAIVNKDSSAVYEIDNTDVTMNRTSGVQSVTAAKYSDIVALDSNVTMIGTPTDYLVKCKAGICSKLGAAAGFRTPYITSLERLGKNVSCLTLPKNQDKSGVAIGTAKGLHISYDNANFNSIFPSNSSFFNDSLTIVHYTNYITIGTNVKFENPVCPDGGAKQFLDWSHAGISYVITHSSFSQYLEEDSVNTMVDIPLNIDIGLGMGGKHVWGTKNGLQYRIFECYAGPLQFLKGISVNKLYEIKYFPYDKYFYSPYQTSNLLIGTDSGLYYDPMNWQFQYYSAVPDSLYLVAGTKGYKINDIDVDACNSTVWLATDKGIVRLKMDYTGKLIRTTSIVHPSNNKPICANAPVTLVANQSPVYSYQWQRGSIDIAGATGYEYITGAAGNYRVVYSYTDGCSIYKDTSNNIHLELDTLVCKPVIADTATLCPNATLFIDSHCAIPGNTCQWYRNGTPVSAGNTSIYQATTDGYYYVRASNCNLSKRSDSIHVISSPLQKPLVSLQPSRALCEGDTAKLSVPSGDYTVLWYSNNREIQSNKNRNVYDATTSAEYVTTVVKGNCAVQSDPLRLVFNPISKVVIVPDKNLPLCEGDVLMLTATNNSNQYLWSSGETVKTIHTTAAGQYKVQSLDYNNCKSEDSIDVHVVPIPVFTLGKDTSFCEGYRKPFHMELPAAFNTYYVNGTLLNTHAFDAPAAGRYIVTVSDKNSCSNSDTIFIFNSCPEIFIPDLITPNGDQLNDCLQILGLLPESTLEVYNRWGNLVYLNKNYNNDWCGEGLSDGIYYYVFKNSYYAKSWKGWIEIMK